MLGKILNFNFRRYLGLHSKSVLNRSLREAQLRKMIKMIAIKNTFLTFMLLASVAVIFDCLFISLINRQLYCISCFFGLVFIQTFVDQGITFKVNNNCSPKFNIFCLALCRATNLQVLIERFGGKRNKTQL